MLGFSKGHGLSAVVVAVQLAVVSAAFFESFNVSYDHRALLIGGKRRMLISAGIHYPRATPEMWPGLIAKSKEGGADVIQTYVFWNGHEPTRGQYNFEGRYDIVKFAKLIGSQGLYLHLRIGPYVCAEWNFGSILFLSNITPFCNVLPKLQFHLKANKHLSRVVNSIPSICFDQEFEFWCLLATLYSIDKESNYQYSYTPQGFPIWLRDIPGIDFRTNNEPFKDEMQRFVKKIVDLMKQEMLFSWQGAFPIFQAYIDLKQIQQIENEYGNIEGQYGQGGKEYVQWAANMALGLGAGVPWVMCKQTDAPETIIPAMHFIVMVFDRILIRSQHFGQRIGMDAYLALDNIPFKYIVFLMRRLDTRMVSDGKDHVISFVLEYFLEIDIVKFKFDYILLTFFGGTNFGRTAGGPFQITSYDYDAPIDEYGLLTQPKWGHLKDLHAALKLCEPALVVVDDSPQYVKLGPMQEFGFWLLTYT
ncbi:putative Beta-galactosidase 6 [Cocos nucifera]|uniref:beta-galactosidase n=1 Tax=Cocos nucifera TaxID=13894 RepID=A0A8K0IXG6_COCNU|nr:putative Beta-galactosidase 6 [Cocos nucifera]